MRAHNFDAAAAAASSRRLKINNPIVRVRMCACVCDRVKPEIRLG